jgi:hypothetical protein
MSATSLFRNRTSNLALVTQNVQRAVLLGTSFVVSAYRQVVRNYDAIQTGVIFTAATVGILLSSLAAGRLARRFRQRTLILTGFVITIAGIIRLLAMVKGHPGAWYFAPGLFLIGVGLGVTLTPSVNVYSPPSRRISREKSPDCPAASPTWGLRSAPRSPAPSWLPARRIQPVLRDRRNRPRPDRPGRDHLAPSRRTRTSSRHPGPGRRAPPLSGPKIAGKAGRVTFGDMAGPKATATGLGSGRLDCAG